MNYLWRFLKTFSDEWTEDRISQHSAAIAYYALFAMAPLLLLSLAIFGWTLGPQAAAGQLHQQLQEFMGDKVATTLEDQIGFISLDGKSLPAALLAGATLLFGATGVFVELKTALNIVWGVRRGEQSGIYHFIRDRLLSFAMVIFIGALLIISVLATSIFSLLRSWLQNYLQVPVELWSLTGFAVAFFVETLLFATVFKVLPDVRFPWKDVWLGAIVTALLFEAGKWVLGWYLGRESTLSSVGAAGSIVILLMWVYYSAMIVLTCAEFVEITQRMRGTPHGPKPALTALEAEAGLPAADTDGDPPA